jgi:hypothetical protein
MTKLMTTIHDLETGEIITREMTADEIVNFENVQAQVAEEKRIESEAISARQALLERLGITADEAALLLS